MKVVFPCKGSLVLLKQDLESLKAFYNTTILTSKLLETYRNSNTSVQVENFEYLPLNNSLILDESNLLSIEKMRDILKSQNTKSSSPTVNDNISKEDTSQISDNDILSNPFFQTLSPLNN